MVGADGAIALPWLSGPLQHAVQTMRGHAVLLHGPQGVGQFELALALAQAWLCEAPTAAAGPCGRCASCHLVQSHGHPDLIVLLPEALRGPLGWTFSADADAGETAGSGKAKPSKEIKVDAVRAAVAFAQTTSARGRGKVVVVHPAERMNAVAANTLLKTLEEPPGVARFVLCADSPDALLPTLRSRCHALAIAAPNAEIGGAWLADRAVEAPQVLLAGAGGQPLAALEMAGEGIAASTWRRLPGQIAAGQPSALTGWPLPRVIDTLHKLCHDALRVACGAAPRYFPEDAIPPGARLEALAEWSTSLNRMARHAEHPWSAALTVEVLVQHAQRALCTRNPAPAKTHSINSSG